MKINSSNMICDPESGVCALPTLKTESDIKNTTDNSLPIHVYYATDPICSACWAIEPFLRRLKLEYGHVIKIDYLMGGLLPDWSYNKGGISKPTDVAHHWDEVSEYYKMPIDGDIWLTDPLDSSFPPSRAVKAAELQGEVQGQKMLRVLREMVFLEKKNITRWKYIEEAGERSGLNVSKLRSDYENNADALFVSDMKKVRSLAVPGFPTLVFVNKAGESVRLTGVKSYVEYVQTILKLYPEATPNSYNKTGKFIFDYFDTLTEYEFIVLSQLEPTFARFELKTLFDEGYIEDFKTKNGILWKKIKQ